MGQEVEGLQVARVLETGIVSAKETFEMEGMYGMMHLSAETTNGTGLGETVTLIHENHASHLRLERGRGHRQGEVFVIRETLNREIWT